MWTLVQLEYQHSRISVIQKQTNYPNKLQAKFFCLCDINVEVRYGLINGPDSLHILFTALVIIALSLVFEPEIVSLEPTKAIWLISIC